MSLTFSQAVLEKWWCGK